MPKLDELTARAFARAGMDAGMKRILDVHWATSDWDDSQKFEFLDKFLNNEPEAEASSLDEFKSFARWLAESKEMPSE